MSFLSRQSGPLRNVSLAFHHIASFALLLVSCVAMDEPDSRSHAAEFFGLGVPSGYHSSQVSGISGDGRVVVGYVYSDTHGEPFRWTRATGMELLGQLSDTVVTRPMGLSADGSTVFVGADVHPTLRTQTVAIGRWQVDTGYIEIAKRIDPTTGEQVRFPLLQRSSTDGSVVFGIDALSNNSFHPWRWTEATGVVGIPNVGNVSLSPTDSLVNLGVSSDGSVSAGWISSGSGNNAFRWTLEAGTHLLLPGSTEPSEAHAISADGSVVIGRIGEPSMSEAFRWTEATGLQRLGMLPGATRSNGRYLSADGSVVAGISNSFSAFRWTAETGVVDLGLQGTNLIMSRDGSVITNISNFDFGDAPLAIWSVEHGTREIVELFSNEYGLGDVLSGWSFQQLGARVTGLSDDGRTIAGTAYNSEGRLEAWVASRIAIPEPASWMMILIGVAATAAVRQRHST